MEAGNFPEDHPVPVGAGAELTEIDAGGALPRTPWQLFWRRFREDKLALGALVFIVLLVLVAIFAPVVVRHRRRARARRSRHRSARPGVRDRRPGPAPTHLFGVDQLGRDVFSRTVYGARVSLIVAFAATVIATVARRSSPGCSPATSAAGPTRSISRFVDVLLAIPYLLLAIGLAAACTLGQTSGGGAGCLGGLIKPGLGVVIFVIAFTSWTYMARIIRGQVAVAAREGVRRGLALAGRLEHADHLPRDPAQPGRADHRLRLDPDPAGDPLRGGALVPRRRGQPTSRAGAR